VEENRPECDTFFPDFSIIPRRKLGNVVVESRALNDWRIILSVSVSYITNNVPSAYRESSKGEPKMMFSRIVLFNSHGS